ncbi:MAG: hypothetical protein M1281_03475 [Chloroflexi bacterium]|nr:hypothetical protein [Chloroflexota bacterium]
MSYLTVFTAPKPFTDSHICLIQENAIRSWKQIGSEVDVILVGDEPGIAEAAARLGVRHLPQVRRNSSGTPLVSSIFELALQASDAPLLAYVNADVVLFPDLLHNARLAAAATPAFLLIGQRWDLDVREPLDFSGDWESRLRERIAAAGRLHPPAGSDYFVYPRTIFQNLPQFAIGRPGWDNWMIFKARREGWAVVDATGSITVVHQDHDYRHLPGGRPPYHLPEAAENLRLIGGRQAIFTLADANFRLDAGRLRPRRGRWKSFWREVEIYPQVHLHSFGLGELFYSIFHPVITFGKARGWLMYQFRKLFRTHEKPDAH